jgi:hypothetical protein
MPLFFLHIRDGNDFFRDPEGIPVRDLDAARTEALESARSLMSQAIVFDGRSGVHRSFEIADETGQTVLVVPFRQAVV